MSSMRELYQEMIIDHSRSPRNHKKLDHPIAASDRTLPECGGSSSDGTSASCKHGSAVADLQGCAGYRPSGDNPADYRTNAHDTQYNFTETFGKVKENKLFQSKKACYQPISVFSF